MTRHYIVIFKADAAIGVMSPAYEYLGPYQVHSSSKEPLDEAVRRSARLVEGDLNFFKLLEPIELSSTYDIRAKCEPLLAYLALGEVSDQYASLQEFDLEFDLGQKNAAQKVLIPLIIVWTPPWEYPPTRSLPAIAEDPNAREAIARMAQGRPPPPTGARSTELLSTQDTQNLDAAYNHRPPELGPPSLVIYDPVFAKFRREMVTPTDTLDLTEDQLDRASRFIDASLRHYPNENARQQALQKVPILDGEFWQTKKIPINASAIEPDGGMGIRSEIGTDFGPFAQFIVAELKNGGGDGGCDPVDQACCGYIKIVSSQQYRPIRLVSCCPAFLVGLSGHTLAIWGAVFADRFFFERLALVYVGPQAPTTLTSPIGGRSDMEVGIREVAKLLRALSICIEDLKAHYTSLSPLPTPTTPTSNRSSMLNRSIHGIGVAPPPAAALPYDSFDPSRFIYWKSFTVDGQKYNLSYTQRLTLWMEKTVFRAVMTTDTPSDTSSTTSSTSSNKVEVVVKFAHRYGEMGHRLLAKAGLAPRLYHCAFDETIRMWVVVMDYIPGRACNRKLVEGEWLSLKHGIELLHAEDIVFGDLREPNVIITEARKKVCLVDFEWCGLCRDIQDGDRVIPRVRYPANISLNRDIGWAKGVGRDLVIEKEHDIHCLNQMCSLPTTM
ncbi:hypothetical protein D9757_006635 [Collybiopsis confluens]|uniref:Protein kinase domain-containing protein n=1 Tax=Collybiopsis confluens TaxID=2823264 RepID=A0A8H5M9N2_9AGAR|nr:hypothetical protein D9757_006635 [Collybiopsis confluens]